jgi:hypothetical protein
VKARRAIDLVWFDPQRARPLLAVPTTPSSRGLWSALATPPRIFQPSVAAIH